MNKRIHEILLSFILVLPAALLVPVSGNPSDSMMPDDPPVAMCQDLTVPVNDTCFALVQPEQLDNGSYDPDADSLIFTMSPEGPFSPGTYEVTLTVTDTTGLFDECTALVEVVG